MNRKRVRSGWTGSRRHSALTVLTLWLSVPGMVGLSACVLASESKSIGIESVGIQQVIDEEQRKIAFNANAQKKVDALYDATREKRQQFQQLSREIKSLSRYQMQMQAQVARQEQQLAEFDKAIADAAVMERELLPLLEKMSTALEHWVEIDLPFQLAERRERVKRLKEDLFNPELTIAQKYQQLLEAYQIEIDFGRGLERFQEIVEIDQHTYQVNVLRVGRVALLCQTADGRITARWNRKQSVWERLDDRDYRQYVKQGLKMVAKQAPNQLLTLPIDLPEVH